MWYQWFALCADSDGCFGVALCQTRVDTLYFLRHTSQKVLTQLEPLSLSLFVILVVPPFEQRHSSTGWVPHMRATTTSPWQVVDSVLSVESIAHQLHHLALLTCRAPLAETLSFFSLVPLSPHFLRRYLDQAAACSQSKYSECCTLQAHVVQMLTEIMEAGCLCIYRCSPSFVLANLLLSSISTNFWCATPPSVPVPHEMHPFLPKQASVQDPEHTAPALHPPRVVWSHGSCGVVLGVGWVVLGGGPQHTEPSPQGGKTAGSRPWISLSTGHFLCGATHLAPIAPGSVPEVSAWILDGTRAFFKTCGTVVQSAQVIVF